jgi:hypothetical protein
MSITEPYISFRMADSIEYIGRSMPGIPSRAEIVYTCLVNMLKLDIKEVTYPCSGPPLVFIKYDTNITAGEIQTQRYIFDTFNKTSSCTTPGIKVPEIYSLQHIMQDDMYGRVRKMWGFGGYIYILVNVSTSIVLLMIKPTSHFDAAKRCGYLVSVAILSVFATYNKHAGHIFTTAEIMPESNRACGP